MPVNNIAHAPPRKRFALTGRSAPVDFRTSAVRGDLADVRLADRIFAPHYAKACPYTVVTAVDLHVAPVADAEVVGALAVDQQFDLLDVSGGWAWGTSSGLVGYVPANTIKPL